MPLFGLFTRKDGPFGDFVVLADFPRKEEALDLLKNLASQVKPLMQKRGFQVGKLTEFYPPQRELLGLNINHGQEICIRLRPHFDPNTFLPMQELLGTLLHEITHIVHGPHDQAFYAYLSNLEQEFYDLRASGYTGDGFYSNGHKLGGSAWSSNVPKNVAAAAAAAAAEKRSRLQRLSGSGALGGSRDLKTIEAICSPAEMAANAALRRHTDQLWCGNINHAKPKDSTTKENGGKNQVLKEEQGWECPQCTLMNSLRTLNCGCCDYAKPWECPRCTLENSGRRSCEACLFHLDS